ncbi:c-type cytochrome [Halovulum sp. GXIMD14794]
MQTKPILAAILTTALIGSAGILAAQDVNEVAQREAAMKKVGSGAKTIGDMLKGETEFNADRANAALAEMHSASMNFENLFPEGTAGAGSNEFVASEKIWEDFTGFERAVATFRSDIEAAQQQAPRDKEQLAAAFGTIGKNCQSCHETYRTKK